MKWKRVVLDEAHNIRTKKTARWRRAVELNSVYRWAVTGIFITLHMKGVSFLSSSYSF